MENQEFNIVNDFFEKNPPHYYTFELIIPKSQEESLNAIKMAIPSYWYTAKNFLRPKYTYKSKRKSFNVSIISTGIGYVPVILKVQLFKTNDHNTKLKAKFDEAVLLRFVIWICTLTMFFGSLMYLYALFTSDVPIVFLDVGLPITVLVASISYLIYSETTRRKEIKKIVYLMNSIFTNSA